MGITDEALARRALQATGGDLQAALDLIFGDVVVVCEECSTLLEVPVVVSAIVVCFVVVEASQSIRKICEGSLLVSTILSLIKHT